MISAALWNDNPGFERREKTGTDAKLFGCCHRPGAGGSGGQGAQGVSWSSSSPEGIKWMNPGVSLQWDKINNHRYLFIYGIKCNLRNCCFCLLHWLLNYFLSMYRSLSSHTNTIYYRMLDHYLYIMLYFASVYFPILQEIPESFNFNRFYSFEYYVEKCGVIFCVWISLTKLTLASCT